MLRVPTILEDFNEISKFLQFSCIYVSVGKLKGKVLIEIRSDGMGIWSVCLQKHTSGLEGES